MTSTPTLIGTPVSPFVRKTMAVLALKRVDYLIDPIVPFLGNDRFGELSPLRRIPVWLDDQVTLADSTVICEYLEETRPNPAVLPASPAERAAARWLEAFADTRLADVLIWRLFNKAVIEPGVWGAERDKAAIQRAIAHDLPPVLDYLES
ncbi:MAG: glutathione S-transferase family protein [Alphaproteobacteria bacterium]|nr:glutathione S-transferase family protein [Alphaproteobacteria bacterium]